MVSSSLNLNAINLKILQIIGDIVVYNVFLNIRLIAHKLRPTLISLFSGNLFHFMGCLSLNFNAINVRFFLQIIGKIVV